MSKEIYDKCQELFLLIVSANPDASLVTFVKEDRLINLFAFFTKQPKLKWPARSMGRQKRV